ncbi:MAG: sugar transferase [Raoultibacter sp.]
MEVEVKSIDRPIIDANVTMPVIGYQAATALYSRPYAWVKRGIDILLSILLLFPAMLIVGCCYIAIKLETKGPAFFVQERPGYRGKIFKIVKLRTMMVETEQDGRELTDMDRITKAGKLIRACSFDELPQIINILLGQMSFIGPRPLLVRYLPMYSKAQMRRHDVLPGISGWAQVNGRNELTWTQKFERDVWYVDHMSFVLDIKILVMTIVNVLKHQGVNAGVNDTMAVFTGEQAANHE